VIMREVCVVVQIIESAFSVVELGILVDEVQ
jgi:hypothetical protein